MSQMTRMTKMMTRRKIPRMSRLPEGEKQHQKRRVARTPRQVVTRTNPKRSVRSSESASMVCMRLYASLEVRLLLFLAFLLGFLDKIEGKASCGCAASTKQVSL